jgi:hypothetical protein
LSWLTLTGGGITIVGVAIVQAPTRSRRPARSIRSG